MTTMFVQENPNVAPGDIPVSCFDMPFLEDAASIQIAFMQLIHGVAHFRLDPAGTDDFVGACMEQPPI